MSRIIKSVWLILLFFLAGCSSFDGLQTRQSHIKNYQQALAEKTNEVLSKKESFGLNDCIAVALANNLNVRSSEIQQKIAKLERKVAFSSFLPAINLDYNYTRWDQPPKMKSGSSYVTMHDQNIREVTWQIQMSIFDPSTWFLYAMHQRGEELVRLVTKYTKQLTVLEVTINYYHCLSLEQAEHVLRSQLKAAAALEKEISAFYEEGLVTEWEFEQAKVHLLVRQTELHQIQYATKQAKADLLSSMGLHPLAEISLKVEHPSKAPDESLETLIAEALISNPQLHIADRRIAIEKEKVKVALAGFLPRLTAFANRTNSSDSYLLYDNFWTYGLTGTMTIFNGFANINEYKAAKQHKTHAFIEAEQQTLVLMLEVVKAHLNLEDAKNQSLLMQKAFNAASIHLVQVEEKWHEGLIDSSNMLNVFAERDTAQMNLMNSRFQQQVSIATLYNVMGITDTNCGENNVAKND